MTTVRIIIMLKPGILDAPGQAVLQGLRALGYDQVSEVRAGRCLELIVPDGTSGSAINDMCERFLANPLIEAWRIETAPLTPLPVGEMAG
jgi:phosphoribosylformylglycinamidine synthase subunit PurS